MSQQLHHVLHPQLFLKQAAREQHRPAGLALAGLNRTTATATRVGESKRTIFNMTQRSKMKQLKSLEHDANLHPEDAFRQTRFLQELNKNYPALVIRRIEENRFAVDEAVQKEYIKALVK